MKHSYLFAVLSVVLPLVLIVLAATTLLANPAPMVLWEDDMEGDVSGWTTEDFTASAVPHFHVDTYLAYNENGHSWWCGTIDYQPWGGYGNSWDDRLELPTIYLEPVPVERMSWGAVKAKYRDSESPEVPVRTKSRGQYPVLTYAYRCFSEPEYDYTYVQIESGGEYVTLAAYDGIVSWTDIGANGFDLSSYGDALNIRFRFVSDGAYSDEDGLFISGGGAFHVDNIKVYDYLTGEVLFFDDVESGGLCTPSVPAAAGDYWHIIDRACPAFSDPHSWWCGDDADTSLVPPNLNNGLYTPLIEVYESYSCTCYAAIHFAVPTVDNDYVSFHGTCDGIDYYLIYSMWGDFEQCDGWYGTAYGIGFSLDNFCTTPFAYAGMLFVMHTTDNGCGPGGGGDAGVMIDDFRLESNWYWGSADGSGGARVPRPAPPPDAQFLHAERYYGR
ncbi:MAG TPA: hypothetical protein VE960_03395 [bacterium]|nr:hypothetical protein [bacterium]